MFAINSNIFYFAYGEIEHDFKFEVNEKEFIRIMLKYLPNYKKMYKDNFISKMSHFSLIRIFK